MPSMSALALFCPAALLLLVIPGPSVLYIVTRSIDQGRRAGFISVLGTHVGSLVHVAVGGWYGLRKGYRGRFAMYVPPLLEHLGLVELEHNPRNNRIRAKD